MHRRDSICLILALAVSLGACGEGKPDGGRPNVIATTSIAADIVRNVAGDDLEVGQIVPDGASPHNYAPSAQEQQRLAESDLLVYFHPALEAALPLESAENSFEIAAHVGELRAYAEGTDPHIWLDPLLVRAALPDLAAALAEIDPANADAYKRRADSYATELTRLDADLGRLVATIPSADRKLVTSHDLIGYFAARYGFDVVGAVFGVAPEAEASAGDVGELIGVVAQAGVPAVFAQQGDDAEVLRLIAAEAGVEVVDDLLLETLGDGAGSYVELMRTATERITDALAG